MPTPPPSKSGGPPGKVPHAASRSRKSVMPTKSSPSRSASQVSRHRFNGSSLAEVVLRRLPDVLHVGVRQVDQRPPHGPVQRIQYVGSRDELTGSEVGQDTIADANRRVVVELDLDDVETVVPVQLGPVWLEHRRTGLQVASKRRRRGQANDACRQDHGGYGGACGAGFGSWVSCQTSSWVSFPTSITSPARRGICQKRTSLFADPRPAIRKAAPQRP